MGALGAEKPLQGCSLPGDRTGEHVSVLGDAVRRMSLSLTFQHSSDVLERTACHDRTCLIRAVILGGFSDTQVELLLQTSDAGFVGMLKHIENTYQCCLSRCSYLKCQPLKGTQSPFQPARETQIGVTF